MARDGWTTVASLLRPYEAELLRGVLESEGIQVQVEDAALTAINDLLVNAVGGAKVLVPDADAARAASLVSTAGLSAGTGAEAPEIPEEEWSAGGVAGAPAGAAAPDPVESSASERAAAHALRASAAAFVLAATIVVPLYAVSASVRALRAPGIPSRRAALHRAWALSISALALALGLLSWGALLPRLRQADGVEQRHRVPRPPPRPPASP